MSQLSWVLTNPIPDLIADKGDLVRFFDVAKFLVPYGVQNNKSAHRTLKMLFDLYDLSSVQKSVMSAKADFCFGNGVKTSQGDVDNTQEFFDFLTGLGIDPSEITDTARACYRDEGICGSTFVLGRITEVNGQWAASIKRLPPTHCLPCYDFDEKNPEFESTILYNDRPISDGFALDSDKYSKWKIAGKWPKVTKRGAVLETIFQMNNVGYECNFWGRPTADSNWLYIDYQQANSTAKISGSEVTSKVLILMKEPDKIKLEEVGASAENVKKEITSAIRTTMTNTGANSQSVASIFYDEEPPEVVQVGINRDFQWAGWVSKLAEQRICAAHGIPATLAALEDLKSSGLSGTLILETLIKTNGMKIVPTQIRFARMFTHIMQFFAINTGFDMGSHKLEFIGPIPEMIEQLKEVRQSAKTNTSANADTIDKAGGGNS